MLVQLAIQQDLYVRMHVWWSCQTFNKRDFKWVRACVCVLVMPDIKQEDFVYACMRVCWSWQTLNKRILCMCMYACVGRARHIQQEDFVCVCVCLHACVDHTGHSARKFRVCACFPVCVRVLFMPDIQQEDFVFVYTSRATTNVIRHVGQMSVRKTKSLYVCNFSKNITCTNCFQKRKEFLDETDTKRHLFIT